MKWDVVLLPSVADVLFSNVDKLAEPGEIPVRLCNYMDVYNNSCITADLSFMEATAMPREIEKFGLKNGDVLVTKDSETAEDIAQAAVVLGDLCGVVCGYHIAIIRPKVNKLYGPYLAKLFETHQFRAQFIRMANGVTRFGLTTEAFEKAHVPLPDYDHQVSIADLLVNWDTAIQKTERLIALRARQKAWILTQVIAATGQTTKLGHFLKQASRPAPKPNEPYWALGIRSHGKGTFQRFVKDPSSVDMEELYALNRDNLIINITFAWEGAIAFVKPEDERCLVSHRFPTYEVNREIADPFFVKYIVNCKAFFSQLALISPGGAGRNRVLNKKDFLKLEVSLPSLAEQKRLAQILATTDLLIGKETSLLAALKSQKRGLMQKLLTGQWRVTVPTSKEVPHV